MKTKPKEIAKVGIPTPPPTAGTPPSRPLPAPEKHKGAVAPAASDPCASLTSPAIRAVIDKIGQSVVKAANDVAANGVTGAYASAANDNLAYLTDARDKMKVLLAWLYASGVLGVPPAPPPNVSNTTGAYNVHGYVRETVVSLHYARHWATISAVYHRSTDARDSYELTTQALELIEPLGAQAGRCYMAGYFP